MRKFGDGWSGIDFDMLEKWNKIFDGTAEETEEPIVPLSRLKAVLSLTDLKILIAEYESVSAEE